MPLVHETNFEKIRSGKTEAYFQGKKELFEGLALETLEKEWTEYPILHLDQNVRHLQ